MEAMNQRLLSRWGTRRFHHRGCRQARQIQMVAAETWVFGDERGRREWSKKTGLDSQGVTEKPGEFSN